MGKDAIIDDVNAFIRLLFLSIQGKELFFIFLQFTLPSCLEMFEKYLTTEMEKWRKKGRKE